MRIYNDKDWRREFFGLSLDPNNIFHYFSAGHLMVMDGYGSFLTTKIDGKILNSIDLPPEVIPAIISSLILYPEVLAEGDDKNYFLEVRKQLRKKLDEKRILIVY